VCKTTEIQSSTNHGAAIFFDGIPNGSTTRREFGSIEESGFHVPSGSSYYVGSSLLVPATTAANDVQVGGTGATAGQWIKKTLAEFKAILGLGTAAYTASGDYAVTAKGVTNGDSHNHLGGDGAQIAYSSLSGLPVWAAWTPTLNTGNADLSGYDGARYTVVGKVATLEFYAANRNVTGSPGYILISLPVGVGSSAVPIRATASIYSAAIGTYINVSCTIDAGNPGTMALYKSLANNNFDANETGVYIFISASYEIA
jgi:hypothetical protein